MSTPITFRSTLSKEKWSLIIALMMALIFGIFATPLSRVGQRALAHFQPSEHVYVETADGQPLPGGLAGNNIGELVEVDRFGRFSPLPQWHHGSTVAIFGPANDRDERKKLGEHVLIRRGTDEWERIVLPIDADQLVAR